MIWDISDIVIYTENGYAAGLNNNVLNNDAASDAVVKARDNGEYMKYVNSTVTYTIPVETAMNYRGSKIVAISVVQDLETLLDDMTFSSFNGSAYLYLTQDNGVIVSVLSHPSAEKVYNIMSIINSTDIKSLSDTDKSIKGMLTSEGSAVYMWATKEETEYMVTTPINTRQMTLRLFYIVPEKVVNETTDSFTNYIMGLSISVILLFGISATALFTQILKQRMKQYDTAILAREYMFDLLAKNSLTAFGLLSTENKEPLFVSNNTSNILGDKYYNDVVQ